jgi:hypothetical protein
MLLAKNQNGWHKLIAGMAEVYKAACQCFNWPSLAREMAGAFVV